MSVTTHGICNPTGRNTHQHRLVYGSALSDWFQNLLRGICSRPAAMESLPSDHNARCDLATRINSKASCFAYLTDDCTHYGHSSTKSGCCRRKNTSHTNTSQHRFFTLGETLASTTTTKPAIRGAPIRSSGRPDIPIETEMVLGMDGSVYPYLIGDAIVPDRRADKMVNVSEAMSHAKQRDASVVTRPH